MNTGGVHCTFLACNAWEGGNLSLLLILYEILRKPGGISNFVVGGAGSKYGLPVAVIMVCFSDKEHQVELLRYA
ncbi:hypothetical protein SAMN02746065_11276 [Desulfocicer vacuolatum DSM 3385]|uniref:Uncharacterized protein n=1 Tax=Desulfocicer vacuolatum DSM 3385 TaxID=1121400 RepID=A0A1W2CKM7_9BACT|nr:hypothetical protein [Desulfocicer vacuolatum]SMC85452.1 hypothetical protein SAMN02746065_11276 [Desulfocicer vacuolatum DSM 3385]